MLHCGLNTIDGINVRVVRKRVRRINLRVRRDGDAALSLPYRGVPLSEAENFLVSNWNWVLRQREKLLAGESVSGKPGQAEKESLTARLSGLCSKWGAALGEEGVTWSIKDMKSQWGACHWVKRHIVFSSMLAGKAQELIEYVVVHEFTHFAVHNHGRDFARLMTERLPAWRGLRKKLNSGTLRPIQSEFLF